MEKRKLQQQLKEHNLKTLESTSKEGTTVVEKKDLNGKPI